MVLSISVLDSVMLQDKPEHSGELSRDMVYNLANIFLTTVVENGPKGFMFIHFKLNQRHTTSISAVLAHTIYREI